jgi:hypothetical protein
MSGSASFRRFDYRLRINKHIERRLVFEVLQAAGARVGFRNHRYIGLGSMWFVDFRLAHRKLRVDEMLSFEAPGHAKRADFNKPYKGIEVLADKTHVLLPTYDAAWWSKPSIWWLDFDGGLTDEVVGDLQAVVQRGAPSSVLVVSVNADRQTYREGDGLSPRREETAVGEVARLLGAGIVAPEFDSPPDGQGRYADVSKALFPKVLCDSLLTYLSHATVQAARVHAGESVTFVPLFSLHHSDNVDMVTVGGALCKQSDSAVWSGCARDHALISDGERPVYTKLDLIPFTVKEMMELDRHLPQVEGETEAQFFRRARSRGLVMDDDDLRKYKRFYRHFPVFAEAAL